MSTVLEASEPPAPPSVPAASLRWLRRSVLRAVPVVALIAVWWLVSALQVGGDGTLVSPGRLAARLVTLWQRGYQNVPFLDEIGASLLRTLAGFLAAALLGVPLGLFMGMSKGARWLLSPVLALLRPIPAIAFIPLFIIWFGIGEFSKILVIFLSSFLYITIATEAAVYAIPLGWQRVALNMGASRNALFRRVIFPASLPGIMTGLRIGLALSWALVVAAELIL